MDNKDNKFGDGLAPRQVAPTGGAARGKGTGRTSASTGRGAPKGGRKPKGDGRGRARGRGRGPRDKVRYTDEAEDDGTAKAKRAMTPSSRLRLLQKRPQR